MRSKTFLTLFVVVFLSFNGFSQELSEYHKGMIVLNSGEVVWGEINYNVAHDLTRCKESSVIKTFSPYQVNYFRFYDEELQINRYFRVVEEKRGQFKKKGFYEVVLEGALPMVRKKKLFTGSLEQDQLSDEKDFDYFVVKGNQLVKTNRFKKEVLKPLMQDYDQEVLSYMKKEKLTHYKLKDQIILIDYYNSLRDNSHKAISNLDSKTKM